MRNARTFAFVAALLCLSARPALATPVTTLNFSDGVVAAVCTGGATGSFTIPCEYEEQGYTITALGPIPFGGIFNLSAPGFELGVGTLLFFPDEADGLQVAKGDGGLFSLLAVDILAIQPDVTFVSPTGVSITYTALDLLTGGPTFTFAGPAWQEIPTFQILHGPNFVDAPTTLDNFVLAAVPLPATLVLVMGGMLALWAITARSSARDR